MYDHFVTFAALRDAVEKLDEPDGLTADELVEGFALRDRLEAWLTAAVAAFDRDECYALHGATSTTAWLHHHTRQTAGEARRIADTGRKLRSLPHLADAWRRGTVTSGQIRAVAAIVPNRHLDAFAEAEAVMTDAFAALDVTETVKVLRRWVAAADDAQHEHEPDEPDDALQIAETLDGRRVLNGHLSPDNAVEVEQAITHARRDDAGLSLPQRNADALVEICRFFNNHNTKAGGRRNRPHLTVLVREDDDGEPVGSTLGGTPVSTTTLRQWLCDANVERLLTSGGHILDYGTSITTVPQPIWRAVAARDHTCRFGEGCTRAIAYCEAHHVIPCEHGGPTVITNLALFCSYHHHLIHSPGWNAAMEPSGVVHITAPDGTSWTTHPPLLRDTLWPPGPSG
jgi:5-methylcytosine-specific restriction protein A